MMQLRSWLWPPMPGSKGASVEERRDIELARQYAASADVLWYAGHRSAAIHHAERGLCHAVRLDPETAVEALPVRGEGESSEGRTVEQWIGSALPTLPELERKRLQEAANQLEEQRVPAVDREVPMRAGSYYRALLRIQQQSLTPHLQKLHTRFGVWMRRLRTVLLVLITGAMVAYFSTRPAAPATATASATFSATYPASAVIDGAFDSRTNEWILPHRRKVGWVEVKLGEAETIEKVRIKNASHPPHHTYGTKTFRLEVYDGASLAFKQEGSFGKPDVKSPWFASDKIDKRADRIRVYVLSNYGPAGGLAEIDWN